jgi:hypothetical protein
MKTQELLPCPEFDTGGAAESRTPERAIKMRIFIFAPFHKAGFKTNGLPSLEHHTVCGKQ